MQSKSAWPVCLQSSRPAHTTRKEQNDVCINSSSFSLHELQTYTPTQRPRMHFTWEMLLLSCLLTATILHFHTSSQLEASQRCVHALHSLFRLHAIVKLWRVCDCFPRASAAPRLAAPSRLHLTRFILNSSSNSEASPNHLSPTQTKRNTAPVTSSNSLPSSKFTSPHQTPFASQL